MQALTGVCRFSSPAIFVNKCCRISSSNKHKFVGGHSVIRLVVSWT